MQDPENPENVGPHLLGMMAGIVNIGVDVMSQKHIPFNADYPSIEKAIDQLDSSLIQECEQILSRSITRSKITLQ